MPREEEKDLGSLFLKENHPPKKAQFSQMLRRSAAGWRAGGQGRGCRGEGWELCLPGEATWPLSPAPATAPGDIPFPKDACV